MHGLHRGQVKRLPEPADRKTVPIEYMRESITEVGSGIQLDMGKKLIFDEKYRVVGVERDRLLLRGVHSGDVLTVLNPEPGIPLTQEEYPVGKLIALTDPSCAPLN